MPRMMSTPHDQRPLNRALHSQMTSPSSKRHTYCKRHNALSERESSDDRAVRILDLVHDTIMDGVCRRALRRRALENRVTVDEIS